MAEQFPAGVSHVLRQPDRRTPRLQHPDVDIEPIVEPGGMIKLDLRPGDDELETVVGAHMGLVTAKRNATIRFALVP